MPYRFVILLALGLLAACGPAPQAPSGGPSPASPQPGVSAQPSATASPAPGTIPGTQPGSQPGTPASSPGAQPSAPAQLPAGVASLKIEAASRFLTFKGQTAQLSVVLLDAANQPISVSGSLPLEWTSSRPQDISVDASGKVTALLEDGYSVIGAKLTGTSFSNTLTLNITQESSGGGGGGGGGGTPRPTPSASAQFVGGFN